MGLSKRFAPPAARVRRRAPLGLADPAWVRDTTAVDAMAHYRQLLQLGREEFLAAAAPAALVRFRGGDDLAPGSASTITMDDETVDDSTQPASRPRLGDGLGDELEVYPLAKKPGASFPDRITIGRTSNNDVTIADPSVSRLHAYVKRAADGWVIADAGSKNGSWLRGESLEARREKTLSPRAVVRIGDVDLTFYLAADLYAALGGT